MIDYVDLGHARCVHEAEMAIEVENDAVGRFWVAKRGIHIDSEVQHLRDMGELLVTRTWYKEPHNRVAAKLSISAMTLSVLRTIDAVAPVKAKRGRR